VTNTETALSSGQLAKRAGVGVETLRFYEREGLLTPVGRRESGYRIFSAEEIRRLRFIKRAQQLGFTLREVKELLALWEDPEADRTQVREKALAKVAEIEARIKDLQEVRDNLVKLHRQCHGKGPARHCPIMLGFAGGE
jgi:MerR family transcriptional regulator, copper efflux regulator